MKIYEQKIMDANEKDYYLQIIPWWMSLVLFFTGWFGIKIIVEVVVELVLAIGGPITSETQANAANMWVNFITYVILAAVFLAFLIFYKKGVLIKRFLKEFKNPKIWINALIGIAMIYAANYIISLLLFIINPSMSDNNNEASLDSILKIFPIQGFLMTVILAPFAEEMTYRIGLFSALKRVNLILAFIVTALVFGLIHFDLSGVIQGFNTGTEESRKYAINELCNLPLYCSAGFVLAYIYHKSNSIASPFLAHLTNNLISFLITIAM